MVPVPGNFRKRRSDGGSGHTRERDVLMTVEQLVSLRGDVVASTVLDKALCATEGCIRSEVPHR
jgi:hypothetical protein